MEVFPVKVVWRSVLMDSGAQCVTGTAAGVRGMLRLSADSWASAMVSNDRHIPYNQEECSSLIGEPDSMSGPHTLHRLLN